MDSDIESYEKIKQTNNSYKTDIYEATAFEGSNLSWNLNLFTGPKFIITCGKCRVDWEQRIPIKNYPILMCPSCNSRNRLNLIVD